jgi:hypothetical protein
LSVSGEAKNCEKCGSCAEAQNTMPVNKMVRRKFFMEIIVVMTKDKKMCYNAA